MLLLIKCNTRVALDVLFVIVEDQVKVWVLFDSRAEGEPIWLGRVLSNPAWEGMGILHNTTRRICSYENGRPSQCSTETKIGGNTKQECLAYQRNGICVGDGKYSKTPCIV